MVNQLDVVEKLIPSWTVSKSKGSAFAPTNIALCKYWGKRNEDLNLPATSSLSVSLNDRGTCTSVSLIDEQKDRIIFNGDVIDLSSDFVCRVVKFLDLFRFEKKVNFLVDTKNNIPTAAGLASSASGFASLVLALNDLFEWNLSTDKLSILARLGSGSACRSVVHGFAKWNAGVREDGMDSFAESLSFSWEQLRVGLLVVSNESKSIGSREGMKRTVTTSPFYKVWPEKVEHDLRKLEASIAGRNFSSFGQVSESNALAMHATMMTSWPPLVYSKPETLSAMNKIWRLRSAGLSIYFTQDAGPNLILLFLEEEENFVRKEFPEIQVVKS